LLFFAAPISFDAAVAPRLGRPRPFWMGRAPTLVERDQGFPPPAATRAAPNPAVELLLRAPRGSI